jgi:SAM-dependent methyltransferase
MTDPIESLPEHVAANREVWDGWAAEFAPRGHRAWASDDPHWGIWNVPELETARALQQEFGLEFPLLLGNAEHVPYPDGSFDFAISEYGACLWADPYAWVPEAARLLRPGGQLVFLTNHVILMLTAWPDNAGPADERLVQPYFHEPRYTWPDDNSVEFHLAHGEWIRLLREQGFEIERLVEIKAPETALFGGGGAQEGEDAPFGLATRSWARRWPTEEVWVARKRA